MTAVPHASPPPSPQALLSAIIQSSDDAIVSKDLNGIITSWNEGAQRIFGYTADETIGRSITMLIPSERLNEETDILSRIRRGERVAHFETVRQRKDGSLFDISVTISPVRDQDGIIVGASKIGRDITQLKRLSQEREQLLKSERAARVQIEEVSRAKDDFLAVISHELRTPLNAIVGWTEVLGESPEDRGVIREAVDVIIRNAASQSKLIEDLLDLGRMSSGTMALDVGWVDLNAITRDAISSAEHAARAKGIDIKVVAKDVRGTLMGDKHRLQQVVWNLLSNAVKFTPKGGRVVVTLARVDSHVELVVSDNGQGIDQESLPRIFERFYQADSSTRRRAGGLGIGLSLVKQLVELHGGEVRAESPGPGQGSTFTVSLPVMTARTRPTDQPLGEPNTETPTKPLALVKVLAVDDDKDGLAVVGRILASRGAIVQVAEDASHALAILEQFTPDVILSDIGMPEMDGFEFIRRVRNMPDKADIPAAALTALTRDEDRILAIDAGFQTHVAKPVSPTELVAVVRSLAAVR